jgi:hypothetical protein
VNVDLEVLLFFIKSAYFIEKINPSVLKRATCMAPRLVIVWKASEIDYIYSSLALNSIEKITSRINTE